MPAGSATNTDSQVDGIIGESGAAGYPIGDVTQAVGHGGNKRYCHSTRANRSVKGKYGVGVGPAEQKHPVGRFTAGKHSKPRSYRTEIKGKGIHGRLP